MAETKNETPAKESMYRNRTKVTQIVYPRGQWDKRIVHPGHTVCLTEAQHKRYFSLFEAVKQGEKPETAKK